MLEYDYTLEGIVRSCDGRYSTMTTEGSRLDGHTMQRTVEAQAYVLGMTHFVWYMNGSTQGFALSTNSAMQ